MLTRDAIGALLTLIALALVLSVFPGPAIVEPTPCEPIASQAGFDDPGIELKDGAVVRGVA